MQALSTTFSWVPEFMHGQSHDKMACTKPHPKPVVNIPIFSNLKRKRTDSWSTPSPVGDAPSKRQKRDMSRQPSATPEGAAKSPVPQPELKEVAQATAGCKDSSIRTSDSAQGSGMDQGDATTQTTMDLTPAQRDRVIKTVQRQLDLEILFKNDELRFIEQELAKCQIAMEQIRRCKVIPFPGQPGSQVTPFQIGNGTGPVLEPPPSLSRADHPSAWGVTDGPYSRHYARWLIPDSVFDPAPPQSSRQHTGRQSISGRTTRGAVSDSIISTSRGHRGSTGSKLQALPSNYPVPKDRNAPLIATRPSDGKQVRLVCKFCKKDNISSMQGFLNHCRIQHKFEYTSHGQAADDCGLLLEEGELPAATAPVYELPTPISATTPSSNKPLVHPLILAEPQERRKVIKLETLARPTTVHFSLPNQAVTNVTAKTVSDEQRSGTVVTNVSSVPATDQPTGHASFVPSPLAPRLSSLLQKRGVGLDLKTLVESAKDPSDFENICDQFPSDDEQEEIKPSKPRTIAKPKSRRVTGQAGSRPPGLQLQTQPSSASSQRPSQSEAMQSVPTAGALAGTRTLTSGAQTLSPGSLSIEPSPKSSSFARSQPAGLVSPYLSANEDRSSPALASERRSSLAQANNTRILSPHTADKNPGLVTDEDGDSYDEEDAESDAGSDGGVDLGVVEHQEPDVRVRGQGHDEDRHHREHQSSGDAKTQAEGLRLRGGGAEGFRGLSGGGVAAAARRARPGKGGKGKGGGKKGGKNRG